MRILIVGNGGREHTLLWKLRRDAPNASFYATRPNGGMTGICQGVDISPTDVVALAGWAASRRIDLAVIGPENPLAAGLADRMQRSGVPVFGPSAGAARIESSKAFAKDLMAAADVPTAAYEVHTDPDLAAAFIEAHGAPVVVKASGLAAGKGAVVCDTESEAVRTARSMLDGAFGQAGSQVVIEEYMEGEELSVFCITDGEDYTTLLPSQDHKRIGEGDTGPNTGGMGAYAPVGFVTDALMADVGDIVIEPVLKALADAGSPFRGLLYAGLMVTPKGPRVVEFNCRFGDPETQAVLPLLSSSLLDPMMAVAEGSGLGGHTPVFEDAAAVTTVLAAPGYPGSYPKGAPISIPPLPGDVQVFHAGTSLADGQLVTSGGRVLAVTAVDPDFQRARRASRAVARAITFEGRQFREDIGWREASRRGSSSGAAVALE
ncbi:MAG: phosphoribosylamine--glycine ligase [Gemmatimonadetes bacterium]|nr:phosphoribosylamine--glycine ligase [Gemmatimonadota bacterium]